MAEVVPCRVCGDRPNRYPLTTQEGVEKWRVLHHCQGKLRPSQEEGVTEWNAANAAPAPALLALATLGASVARTVINDPSDYVDLDYLDLTGVMDNDRRWYQPGIADAIATLLAPDGAGEVGDA